MKRVLLALLATSSFYFSSCDKESNSNPMDGLWYTRTEIVQLSNLDKPITTFYKLYKKIDVENKRYKTYSFKDNKLTIAEYTRDLNINRDIINKTEYTFTVSGNKLLLTDSNGKQTTLDHQFYGLGNKSLRLEANEYVSNTTLVAQTKTSKTVLIREFPIDDTEQEQIGPDGGSGTPVEVQ